jgi:hypothetical protein
LMTPSSILLRMARAVSLKASSTFIAVLADVSKNTSPFSLRVGLGSVGPQRNPTRREVHKHSRRERAHRAKRSPSSLVTTRRESRSLLLPMSMMVMLGLAC